ncbi:MAG: hypothetical protein QOE11_2192, partial [Solirubrobacteraceae bacterium]|nr:hypothetical protein [Solirubrobacteraceae bacterium]
MTLSHRRTALGLLGLSLLAIAAAVAVLPVAAPRAA